jgi:hypothetical protein
MSGLVLVLDPCIPGIGTATETPGGTAAETGTALPISSTFARNLFNSRVSREAAAAAIRKSITAPSKYDNKSSHPIGSDGVCQITSDNDTSLKKFANASTANPVVTKAKRTIATYSIVIPSKYIQVTFCMIEHNA